MTYTDKSKLIFPYEFLTDRKYRMWRHVLVIIGMAVISFNKAHLFYNGYFAGTGMGKIYIHALLNFASYIAVIYIGIYILIPKYIQSQKFGRYIILLLGLIAVCTAFQEGLRYIMLRFYESSSTSGNYSNLDSFYILDLCSAFTMDAICLIGVSATIFLKHWVADTEQVFRLEKEQVQMEVEHLKEQLNPISLFDILNRAGNLAKKDKEKASEILMELSSVLRYQLYDCARECVFINSEIEFIQNYMRLQQLCYPDLKYTISASGNLNMILTPPLLFIPFIQFKINELSNGFCSIEIKIQATDTVLTFTCSSNNCNRYSLNSPQLSKITRRLNILYPVGYELTSEGKEIKLQLSLQ